MRDTTPKNIAVLGLSYPFRGGIAHYSTLLVRELRKKYPIRFITLLRQYPHLLFPGKTQYDDSNEPLYEENEPRIDSINPLTWIRTAFTLQKAQVDFVIVQWWNPFFGLAFGTIVNLLYLLSKQRTCFLCHNITPHENTFLDKVLSKYAFLTAIPAARIKVLCDPLISSWQQPIGHLSPAFEKRFLERAAQRLAETPLLVVSKAQPAHHDQVSSHSIDQRHPGQGVAIRRNPTPRWGPSSSSHTRGLRTGAAWMLGHNHRTRLSSVPTVDVCSRVWPTPLGTGDSTSVGPDPLRTPTSSTRQTPLRDVDSHGHNCARSGRLGFSAY